MLLAVLADFGVDHGPHEEPDDLGSLFGAEAGVEALTNLGQRIHRFLGGFGALRGP
jgi:hypothetical protein